MRRLRIPLHLSPITPHVYEIRPRRDRRGFDLTSDVLPFGRLWYGESNAASNAVGHQLSQKAKEAHAQLCADLELIFDTNVGEAQTNAQAGDQAGARQRAKDATAAHSDARNLGCSWA